MICFEENSTLARCMESCDISTGWLCKELGDRTRGDWSDTVVIGDRAGFTVRPAATGATTAGTTLYCIMTVLPNSTEEQLRDVARNEGASVFGCDAHDVFLSWWSNESGSGTGSILQRLLRVLEEVVKLDVIAGDTDSQSETAFVHVFEHVRQRGMFLHYDWTVKVDADCVFVPSRLRNHINALRAPAFTPIYIKDNANGFLGAVEIFSTKAMMLFFDNAKGCYDYFGTAGGEHRFLKYCMDAIGVGFMQDEQIVAPGRYLESCSQVDHVAFHPHKLPQQWQRCWTHICATRL